MRLAGGYWQRARLATFMLGHFSVDLMSGLLPALYPLLALELQLEYGAIGALALAYTAAVSLTQPLFGYLADRWGVRRLAPLSLAWSGLFLGLYGFVHHPELLYPLAFLAGLGSGAYHPVGASRAAQLAPEHHRNTTMSVYTVSGTVGYALGPLVGALLFRAFGSAGTLVALPLDSSPPYSSVGDSDASQRFRPASGRTTLPHIGQTGARSRPFWRSSCCAAGRS